MTRRPMTNFSRTGQRLRTTTGTTTTRRAPSGTSKTSTTAASLRTRTSTLMTNPKNGGRKRTTMRTTTTTTTRTMRRTTLRTAVYSRQRVLTSRNWMRSSPGWARSAMVPRVLVRKPGGRTHSSTLSLAGAQEDQGPENCSLITRCLQHSLRTSSSRWPG